MKKDISYEPLYLQVKDVMASRIVSGKYPRGKIIPSEAVLSKEFKLSISTIRQAVSILVSEGLLIKKQGSGTFVSEQKIKLRFLTWIGESLHGEKILREMLNMVDKAMPNVEVEVFPTTYPTIKSDLVNLISNGNAPDVAQIINLWTNYFASMGALEPLDLFIDKKNLDNRLYDADIVSGVVDRRLYSVSWSLSPISHIANIKVLKQYGYNDFPQHFSLEKLSEICSDLESKFTSTDQYSYAITQNNNEVDFLSVYPFLLSFGGGFNVKARGPMLYTQENITAFTWIREFVKKHKIFFSDIFTVRRLFARGNIAIIADGPWIKYIMKEHTNKNFDENFNVFLNPSDSEKSSSYMYNHSLVICSQSRHKLAAAKFIELITGNNEISEFFSKETGMLPVNVEQQKRQPFDSDFFNCVREQMAFSKCINANNPMFDKAMVFCKDAVHKILFEGADIEKELKEKEYYLKMIYGDK